MKQIIAMGGGGFSMEPDNLSLDQYIINQTKRKSPRICFLPTASGDSQNYVQRFYHAFQTMDCVPSHLSLCKPLSTDILSFVMEQDVIYVGGGNTRNMLVLWKEWGLDLILREAWKSGVVLAGLSAGAMCWFEEGVTDSAGPLTSMKSLGFLHGSFCPHYDSEKERRPIFHQLICNGFLGDGYAADDGAALHFINDQLFQTVSSRPGAKAYRVTVVEHEIFETPLPVKYLG
ncbi:Type 1 glutamine amidotransferase-like domain-containing protein [Bacillus vallismortis]|uniref:Type 1 glutamine amidotransferase-like domain-containing protein n=1 Tax=Bacillus vallismortis TaxID=72361 RepID=UPI002DC03206|nr:Type 1 glutamine amidotransferase-like domain-containing protein [Bacillus vallismortis]MEC1268656.1 Type 1 glutamine amidotransferase-like domain-containing protein [Bacillus vallismortis]